MKIQIKQIIKIQNQFRSAVARRKADALRKDITQSQYFCIQDFKETLKPVNFDQDQDLLVIKYTYKSGAVYYGDWLGGFRHGDGKITFKDGSTYDGEWNIGKAHGKGVFKQVHGDEYEGSWYCDMKHGYGKLTRDNGTWYEGDWFKDTEKGLGRELYQDGS